MCKHTASAYFFYYSRPLAFNSVSEGTGGVHVFPILFVVSTVWIMQNPAKYHVTRLRKRMRAFGSVKGCFSEHPVTPTMAPGRDDLGPDR